MSTLTAMSPPPESFGGGGQASQAGDAVLLGSDGLIPSDLYRQASSARTFALNVNFNSMISNLYYNKSQPGDSTILTVHRDDGLDILFIGDIGTTQNRSVSLTGWGILRDDSGVRISSRITSSGFSGSTATYYVPNESDQTYTIENNTLQFEGTALIFPS